MQLNFNPRSHKGSDTNNCLTFTAIIISIHAPTRGATVARYVMKKQKGFQSTLPQGERLNTITIIPPVNGYFNPRSHKGSDSFPRLMCIYSRDFNPRSHKGSDFPSNLWADVNQAFQSTLPQGERRLLLMLQVPTTLFQSTLPQGERHVVVVIVVWIM